MNLFFNPNISNNFADKIREVVDRNSDFLCENFREIPDIYFYKSILNSTKWANEEVNITGGALKFGAIFVEFREEKIDENELIFTLVHELNHELFYENNYNFNYEKLMNLIILEGLAKTAEREFARKNNIEIPDFLKLNGENLNDEDFYFYLEKAMKIQKNNEDFDYDLWLYNFAKNQNFPENLGYKIGIKLIKKYLEFTKQNISRATQNNFREIFEFAKRTLEENNA